MQKAHQNKRAAFELLGMRANEPYTLRDVSKRYRAAALRVHPDRTGGDARQFDELTRAYMLLVEMYKNEQTDRSCHDLREESRRELQAQQPATPRQGGGGGGGGAQTGLRARIMGSDNAFDAQLFNKIYSENRLSVPTDEGYGDWLNDASHAAAGRDETPPVFSNKFNLNIFNSAFEQLKDDDGACNQQLMKRDAPDALVQYAGQNTAFSDLGVEAMDDFSGTTSGGLTFTDLKQAHTNSKLINAKRVGFTQHRTMEDLEAHRSSLSFDMSPEDTEREARRERVEKDAEMQRRQNVQARDQVITDHHLKMERLLLQ